MAADWNQAVDAQTDLISFWRSNTGLEYGTAFVNSLAGKQLQLAETGELYEGGDEDDRRVTLSSLAAAIRGLSLAEPIWVESEVCELIQTAAETFQPEAIYVDDLLIDHGFVLFERPLYLHDINDRRLATRAIAWNRAQLEDNPGKEALVVSLYAHRLDDDDFSGTMIGHTPDGLFPRMGGSDLTLSHFTPVFFGNTAWLKEPSQAELSKLLQVFWRLAKQEIAIPGRMPVARATWRRAKWREIKHVTIFTLRRIRQAHSEPEESEVNWSHRWMVNGHWRNQPYKIDGETVHRQIWIAPYVKGPEDRPLVIKKRIYDFRR